MSNPTVSVIVPVYNAFNYIEKTLNSLVLQSYKDIELLCIDDGSSDASLDVLYKYAKKYKNVIVFKQKNKGVSSARNKGIENASGDYIFFCDADDWIDLDLIEKLVKTAKNNPNNDLFACGFYKEFENNKDIKEEFLVFNKETCLKNKDLSDYLLQYAYKPNKNPLFVTVWGKLIRAKVVHSTKIRFLEDLSTFEDVLFNFELLTKSASIVYVPVLGYHYSIHKDNNSASMSANDLFGFVSAMETLKKLLVSTLKIPNNIAHKAVSHAIVSYSIIQTIRLCSSLSVENYLLIRDLLRSNWLQQSIKFYEPKMGDSKAIPFFIKHRKPLLVMIVGYNKFLRRYK